MVYRLPIYNLTKTVTVTNWKVKQRSKEELNKCPAKLYNAAWSLKTTICNTVDNFEEFFKIHTVQYNI